MKPLFILLNYEFGLLKDLISKSKENITIDLNYWIQSQIIQISDKSSRAKIVARNLDQITIEYPELLQ